MVLDLHGQPSLGGIERRPLGHGPRAERPVVFQPQVEMQVTGGVLLDHEPQGLRRRDLDLARRLGRLREVAHRLVLGELGRGAHQGHARGPATALLHDRAHRTGRPTPPGRWGDSLTMAHSACGQPTVAKTWPWTARRTAPITALDLTMASPAPRAAKASGLIWRVSPATIRSRSDDSMSRCPPKRPPRRPGAKPAECTDDFSGQADCPVWRLAKLSQPETVRLAWSLTLEQQPSPLDLHVGGRLRQRRRLRQMSQSGSWAPRWA
jgi:hypothetical protein